MSVTERYISVTSGFFPMLLNPKSRSLTTLHIRGDVPELVVVDDEPTPIPVVIEQSDTPSLVVWSTAAYISVTQRYKVSLHLFERDTGPGRDGLLGHVHHAVRVGQDEQVHKEMAKLVIVSDGGIENLREDFGVHYEPLSRPPDEVETARWTQQRAAGIKVLWIIAE